jgi:hypothetical protein
VVAVARVGGHALSPARFVLVGTMSMCPKSDNDGGLGLLSTEIFYPRPPADLSSPESASACEGATVAARPEIGSIAIGEVGVAATGRDMSSQPRSGDGLLRRDAVASVRVPLGRGQARLLSG